MKILVVEDERQLCEDIAEDLELERYTVERCYDGLEAWEHILVESYDLVILDLNLPGMDGLDILRAVRGGKPELRVLILSARSSLADRVGGLDLGGGRLSHQALPSNDIADEGQSTAAPCGDGPRKNGGGRG